MTAGFLLFFGLLLVLNLGKFVFWQLNRKFSIFSFFSVALNKIKGTDSTANLAQHDSEMMDD